ncbi:MAG TPA: choice-of-anchor tandem repeat GloVer-containing protein [Verrucomicrobiae bacterium]|nr:choice-of-anchor tandem repeat GloVer-containing protein [Verrucomicrobiae bacterium]
MNVRADLAWQVLAELPTNSLPAGNSPLAFGLDGSLYGTTRGGGTNGSGDIFEITPSGQWTELYSFTNGVDGASPIGGLALASDGNFYGTTQFGGANGAGAIFRISPRTGIFASVGSFDGGNEGSLPNAGLMQASDGLLYGTTYYGGTNGFGGIYSATLDGTLTELYSFTNGVDGVNVSTVLLQGTDGGLYGTSSYGGATGNGTIFKITTGGDYTVLYTFTNGADGNQPGAGLVELAGKFYGTTSQGGSPVLGNPNGTVFSMTPSGSLTPLYAFTGGNDGSTPSGPLTVGNNGNLYGTTLFAGPFLGGTTFELTLSGTLTNVVSFNNTTSGSAPTPLVEGADLNFYGFTVNGASNNAGAIFQFSSSVEQPGLQAQISPAEYSALTDFYNFTTGSGWFHQDNWLDGSAQYWYGVTVGLVHYNSSWGVIAPAPIIELNLGFNNLVGTFPSSFSALTGMQQLLLRANTLSGGIPAALSAMPQLQQLDLSYNPLAGSIPSSLGNLNQLQDLYFSADSLTATIPDSLTNLVQLQNLSLNANTLTGSIPAGIGALTQMVYLDLSANILTDEVPDGIGNLAFLQNLYLNQNDLSGDLPDSLGNLTNLNNFSCNGNALTGTLSDWITNMVWAQSLDFGQNIFTGELPKGIGALTNLMTFNANNNGLTNGIPTGLTNLIQLQNLNLGQNQLTGRIPGEIGDLWQLTTLQLNNNNLTGNIPKSLQYCSNVNYMDLSNNQLTNGIPAGLTNLTQLGGLYLNNNNLTGSIPDGLGNLGQLYNLNLSVNYLSGNLPSTLPGLTSLHWLSLDDNMLSGGISSFNTLTQMISFVLSRNNFSGPISGGVTNMTQLTYLDFHQNQLTGGIPSGLGNMASALYINLSMNPLRGSIPADVGSLGNLGTLLLSSNELSGGIPNVFSGLGQLNQLDLSHNDFTGTLPATLYSLSNLTSLYLGANNLSGGIPLALTNLNNLVILDLDGNDLTGTVAPQIGAMPNLQVLQVFSNSLSGQFFSDSVNFTDVTYNDYDFNAGSANAATVSEMIGNSQTVNFLPQNIPTMVDFPESFSQPAGSTVSLSVEVDNATSYEWLFNGEALDGSDSNPLNLTNVQTANAGSYQLIASNAFGTATSMVATVTVTPAGPTIVTEPGPVFDYVTTRARVVLAAGVDGSAPMTYGWRRNGTPLSDNGRIIGSQSNILTITSALTNDDGAYQLFISNAYGSTNTVVVNLAVGALSFTNFASVSNLTFNGSAVATNDSTNGNYIRLTQAIGYQAGSVFLNNPISLADGTSFSTEFSFRIISNGADGITFTLQSGGPGALGQAGGDMGYGGIDNSVAIDFDTYQDGGDPSGNYIGLVWGGNIQEQVYGTPTNQLSNGNIWYSWIDYDGATGDLEVRASESPTRPATPVYSATINILTNLGTDSAYFGFTGGTGGSVDQQEILSWQLFVGTQSTNGPVVVLNGNAETNVECHSEGFVDPGATASESGIGALPVTVLGGYNTNSPGTYTIMYEASDASGNTAVATRTVDVVNTNPPIVTLYGNAVTNVQCHTMWSDPGAVGYSQCAGTLATFFYQNDVDTNTPGTYTNIFEADDSSGIPAFASRIVNVVDTIPPAITVFGMNPTYALTNSDYVDAGATAFDGCAGDLPVCTNGSVNVDVPGAYTITYTATDPSGNSTTNTRIVLVVTNIPPYFIQNTEPTNQLVVQQGTAVFSVIAGGSPQLYFQWMQNGTNLTDSASIIGSQSNILTISNAQAGSAGTYYVVVSNASTAVASAPALLIPYAPSPTGTNLIQNGGFELGSYADWTIAGDTNNMYITQSASAVHSGKYAALVGNNALPEEYLSQNVPTVVNGPYLISLWVANYYFQIRQDFQIIWDGTVLEDVSNTQPFDYTNLQFIVTAPLANSTLEFEIFGTYGILLDDVSVSSLSLTTTVAPPSVSFVPGSIHATNDHLSFQITGLDNQGPVIIATSTNLLQWTPIYTNPSGSGSFEFTDSNSVNSTRRFYRATVSGP